MNRTLTTVKWTPEYALDFAAKAHEGQADKLGQPYILHPLAVAEIAARNALASTPAAEVDRLRVVALMHDVLEDCPWISADDLLEDGLDPELVHSLSLMNHRKSDPYQPYVMLLAVDRYARPVKIADISHNLSPERQNHLPASEQERLRRKYEPALEYLLYLDAQAA